MDMGKPIVRLAAEAAIRSKARPVVVVTGYKRAAVEAARADLDVGVAFNLNFPSGLASSLRVGLSDPPRDVMGALVFLGDMPWIEPRLIDALIDAFLARTGAPAAAPSRDGRRGNPVFLGRGLFEAAMRLKGDEGPRADWRTQRQLTGRRQGRDMGATFDVDTPDDLAAAQRFRRGDA